MTRRALRPVLSAVINPQDFDALLLHTVNGDIGEGRKQDFSGGFLASGAATVRPLFQGTDGLVQFAYGRLLIVGMVFFEVIADAL